MAARVELAGCQEVPDNLAYDNAFKAQWELFLRHLAGKWVDVPRLKA